MCGIAGAFHPHGTVDLARLRRMSRLPSPVQTALLPIFRHRRVAEFLVRATRPH